MKIWLLALLCTAPLVAMEEISPQEVSLLRVIIFNDQNMPIEIRAQEENRSEHLGAKKIQIEAGEKFEFSTPWRIDDKDGLVISAIDSDSHPQLNIWPVDEAARILLPSFKEHSPTFQASPHQVKVVRLSLAHNTKQENPIIRKRVHALRINEYKLLFRQFFQSSISPSDTFLFIGIQSLTASGIESTIIKK